MQLWFAEEVWVRTAQTSKMSCIRFPANSHELIVNGEGTASEWFAIQRR
jgi:hypothetical protein